VGLCVQLLVVAGFLAALEWNIRKRACAPCGTQALWLYKRDACLRRPWIT